MSKRFTDTDKYKKTFFRSLPGAYKLFWDYLYHDCNHAGIWHKDFSVAQLYLGGDMAISEADALCFFNTGEERIRPLRGGLKWFVVPFIEFQYGHLNPANRVHASVLNELDKHGIKGLTRPLEAPSVGAKDKDKALDKVKVKAKENGAAISIPDDLLENQTEINDWLQYKKQKGQTYKAKGLEALWRAVRAIPKEKRRETVEFSMANNWSGLFQKKDDMGFTPRPAVKTDPVKAKAAREEVDRLRELSPDEIRARDARLYEEQNRQMKMAIESRG